MLKHTQKVKEIYEDIQKKIFYMIPEKWDKLYLYASIIERLGNIQTGELYFYYIPKGILRKKPVNVYEIPIKFNLDEKEYSKLVEVLYKRIKDLRNEFKKIEPETKVWSNITISIQNLKFKVEYDYEDLLSSRFSSYERHIIWRYKYLNIGIEQCNKEEKEILKKYFEDSKSLDKKEVYETGIYIKNVKNIVGYDTDNYDDEKNIENIVNKNEDIRKNQILMYDEAKNKINL